MYHGKRDGRGTFRFFQSGMDLAQKARARLEAELRAAISRGDIAPFYQPIVALPNRELVGFEVLARWNHATRGIIPPDEFIPIAEETGLISDMFYRLLRRACIDAQAWPSHLQMAINMSPRQLRDQQMPLRIAAILAETGFGPERLETEVTESALINDLDTARTILTSLQELGVKIALDDFGTGYSSLYHLKELKFNKLKIDRSYVTNLQQGSERAKLVDAIIQLGSSLSLQTTAEGIESDVNLDWLSDQGCGFAQGYFFGRPMNKDDVESFLQSSNEILIAQAQAVLAAA
jgi:EAL domain-containing protein (putative c-di-GMP-specific phosphodiesterase class I)